MIYAIVGICERGTVFCLRRRRLINIFFNMLDRKNIVIIDKINLFKIISGIIVYSFCQCFMESLKRNIFMSAEIMIQKCKSNAAYKSITIGTPELQFLRLTEVLKNKANQNLDKERCSIDQRIK